MKKEKEWNFKEKDMDALQENALLNKYLIEFNEKVDKLLNSKGKTDENSKGDINRLKVLKLNIIEKEIKRNSTKINGFNTEFDEIIKRSNILKDKNYQSFLRSEIKSLKDSINATKRNNALLMNDQKRNFKELNSLNNSEPNTSETVKITQINLKEAEEINQSLINKIEKLKYEIYGLNDKYGDLQKEYKNNKKIAVKAGVYLFDSEHQYYLMNLKVVKLEKSNNIMIKKNEYKMNKIHNEINNLKLKNSQIQKKITETEFLNKEQDRKITEKYKGHNQNQEDILTTQESFNLQEEIKKIFDSNKNPLEINLALSPMVLPSPFAKKKYVTEDFYLTSCLFDEKKSKITQQRVNKSENYILINRNDEISYNNNKNTEIINQNKLNGELTSDKNEEKKTNIESENKINSKKLINSYRNIDKSEHLSEKSNNSNEFKESTVSLEKRLENERNKSKKDSFSLEPNLTQISEKKLSDWKIKNESFEMKRPKSSDIENLNAKIARFSLLNGDGPPKKGSCIERLSSANEVRSSFHKTRNSIYNNETNNNKDNNDNDKNKNENEKKSEYLENDNKDLKIKDPLDNFENEFIVDVKPINDNRPIQTFEEEKKKIINELENIRKNDFLNEQVEMSKMENNLTIMNEKFEENFKLTAETHQYKNNVNQISQKEDQTIKSEETIDIKSRRFNMKKLNENKKNEDDFLFSKKNSTPKKKPEENSYLLTPKTEQETLTISNFNFNLFSKKKSKNLQNNEFLIDPLHNSKKEIKNNVYLQSNILKNDTKTFQKNQIKENSHNIFDKQENEENSFNIMEITMKNSEENEKLQKIQRNTVFNMNENNNEDIFSIENEFLLFKDPKKSIEPISKVNLSKIQEKHEEKEEIKQKKNNNPRLKMNNDASPNKVYFFNTLN